MKKCAILLFGLILPLAALGCAEGNGERAARRAAVESRLEEGELQFQRGDYPNALAAFQETLEILPPASKARRGSRLLELEGDEDYRRYLASLHGNAGVALLRMRRYDEAAEELERAVKLDPRRALFQINLGTCHQRSKRFAEASSAFERALELGTEDPQVRIRLGESLLASGRVDEAIETLRGAIGTLPHPDLEGLRVDLWLALGKALAERGSTPEAIDALARTLQSAPGTTEAWYQLSRLLHREGRAEEAAVASTRFSRLVEIEQRLKTFRSLPSLGPEQLLEYAALLNAAELPHKTLRQVERLLQHQPNDPCIWLERARLLETLEAAAEAATSYQRVLALRTDCQEAIQALHRMSGGQGAAVGTIPCCDAPLFRLAQPQPQQDQQDQQDRQ
jgi:tetratricopeptide (TPR) repeat protein